MLLARRRRTVTADNEALPADYISIRVGKLDHAGPCRRRRVQVSWASTATDRNRPDGSVLRLAAAATPRRGRTIPSRRVPVPSISQRLWR